MSSSKQATTSERLRHAFSSGTVVAPGAHSPLIARIVERLGFDTVYLGGYMTAAQLGTIEPTLTLTEQVTIADQIVRSVDLPVIVDADAGFGDVLHVGKTVREFERAGVAAIHIEDQVYPKRVGYHRGENHLVTRDEFVAKLDAALSARSNPDFQIIARVDARDAVGGSFSEAVERAHLALNAGVDAIMPMLHTHPDEMRMFHEAVPDTPLVHLSGFNEGRSVDECVADGFNVILYPLSSLISAVSAVHATYSHLKQTGSVATTTADDSRVIDLIEDLLLIDEFHAYEKQASGFTATQTS